MADEDVSERERALQYAAKLNGLSLVRTGDTFVLVQYKLTGATLDQIETFLAADGGPESNVRHTEDARRGDLRTLLKAEHAMLAEIEQEKRRASPRGASLSTTEAALAEIRRRIAELQEEKQREGFQRPR